MLCISDYLAATGKTDLNPGALSTVDLRAYDELAAGTMPLLRRQLRRLPILQKPSHDLVDEFQSRLSLLDAYPFPWRPSP